MEITLVAGLTYALLNVRTQETAEFKLDELWEYRGKWVLYGEVQQHGISIGRGIRAVKSRSGAFAFLGQESADDVLALSQRLGGYPLALALGATVGLVSGRTAIPSGAPIVPILNSGLLYGDPALEKGYQQGYRGKDTMMRKAARLVDVWLYWKMNHRKLPPWCKTTPPAQQTGLWAP